MTYVLSDFAREQGYVCESYETIGSTNLVAQQRAKEGHPGYLWVTAEVQTQGRARRGRLWNSPRGNLYASLLLNDHIVHKTASQLGFVAGVSMVEAIGEFIEDQKKSIDIIKLKWPNDILLEGAKSSGILLELFELPSQSCALIIGIGMNIKHHYEDAPYLTSSMHKVGLHIEKEQLFSSLTKYFAQNYLLWKRPGGSDIIRKKWLSHSSCLGKDIKMIDGRKTILGTFDGLDYNFNCIVKQEDGQRTIVTVGDVHFGLAHSVHADDR
ncbi:biotin--[acetyl-CoA-carboxylase] ligase [Bartonella ancashensis]|uniref:Biotin-protein ligase n=1 Tax=Bartonella ancashensis TaxID=1318743 RepID=A0A0M4LGZ7_9HYPH|nr:biotin--[acetyl-CoA-carboxylase] ligase [Bartonella ancashensis]ALE03807.1 Biotin-protein ligase [Bartonella ancashensis]